MAKVLWHFTMSLDGFIAGRDHDMDWLLSYTAPHPVIDEIVGEVIGRIGAVLSGRRGYDLGRTPGLDPTFRKLFGGAWSGPQFIMTHHHPADEDDPDYTFLSGDITTAVDTALRAAGGHDLLILGADVARQCIEAGLLDEILVHLAPILLGEGVRFFGSEEGNARGRPVGPSFPTVSLKAGEVRPAGAVTILRFNVLKDREW
ncbi:MAG: dihydrofolate reductase family protein [Spirochaetales bacterium]|nr:dihydrofolate reductase family protein [Spirochaetales bacterium]